MPEASRLARRPLPSKSGRSFHAAPIDWAGNPWPGLGWSAVLAGAAGAATAAGFAPVSFWPAPLLGVSWLAVTTVRARTVWHAVIAAFGFGTALTSITLNWMSMIDLGAALGLILLVTSWYTLLGAGLFVAGRTRWWPLLGAGAWALMEFAAARVPFGGFGWLRLGYAMVDSPLSGLLPLVGVGGLSMATALAAHLLAWLGLRPSLRRASLSALGYSGIVLLAVLGSTLPPAPATGSVTVGYVQGGAPGGGVYGIGPARSTTVRHATGTRQLAAEIEAGWVPQPDVVVWPENATDLDPASDSETRRLINESIAAIGAPLLVGTILNGPGPNQRRTAAQWWSAPDAPGLTYVKRSLVPFGEWIPFRDLLLPLFPQLRYVGAQSVPGQQAGVLPATLRDGRTAVFGVLICFDVAFDEVVYDLPASGAQIIVVQSSNAMYQGSSQVEQQFAITRARAAELRREVLVVTTSGISGVIDPSGTPQSRVSSGMASGTTVLPIRDGITPAAVIGVPLQQLVSTISAAWLIILIWKPKRREWRPPGRTLPQRLVTPT